MDTKTTENLTATLDWMAEKIEKLTHRIATPTLLEKGWVIATEELFTFVADITYVEDETVIAMTFGLDHAGRFTKADAIANAANIKDGEGKPLRAIGLHAAMVHELAKTKEAHAEITKLLEDK